MFKAIPKSSGIYRIVSSCGRQYVGSAVNLRARAYLHWRQLRNGNHHSRFMQRVWNKRGESALRFEVLLRCRPENLIWYEQRAFDAHRPEFNTAPTAGSQLGLKMSAESRAKLAAAARRTRNRLGKPHTEESKRKISLAKTGRKMGSYSAERVAKVATALKGRTIPPEQRAKISATLTGMKQSAETIAKRVLKLRGRKYPPEYGAAISKRLRGTTKPPEQVLKMRRAKTKMTEDQVREIRRQLASGVRYSDIAAAVGVHRQTVADIGCGRRLYEWVT